jgi:pantoate--beta-alanine ligase
METVTTVAAVRDRVRAARAAGRTIALVPTMGAFHHGHLTLMRRAREGPAWVVVSLFVNPTQFNQRDDLDRYPRDPARDHCLAAAEGVELVFAPTPAEIYPAGYQTYVEPGPLSAPLCGATRPGHFRGVATVVTQLLNIVQPDRAYFGEKDFQQLRVIQQLVVDLKLPVTIVPVATVREADGLALSSRNALLAPAERQAARAMPAARQAALAAFSAGERDAAALRATALHVLRAEPLCRPDYVEVVDRETLQPLDRVDRPALLAFAAFFGSARLIDNAQLVPPRAQPPGSAARAQDADGPGN